MSSGEIKKVSRQDIQLVQNLIERCLQLYMTQKEVVRTLLDQAKIEPGFTELVWQKLEEENQEFFRAYHLRLIVKDQIQRFNKLLERHVELIRQICPTGVSSITLHNGSEMRPLHGNSTCTTTENTGSIVKTENMHQNMNANLPNAYANGASTLQQCMPNTVDMSAHSRSISVSPNMPLAQTSSMEMLQGLNGGGMIKSEADYVGNSHFMFGSSNNVLEARSVIADPSISSFSSIESNPPLQNETILDADGSSFGFLGQIPRNFSLSDLTADFGNSTDILESYSKSPFLATDADYFLDPHSRGEHQDIKSLETISEGLSYEDFGSD
nr:uncharacterized protein LOC109162050 [Ipomoea trifida]